MKLKRISSSIDRNERNNINENFDILEQSYGKSAIDAQTAKEQSNYAVKTSGEAKRKAESVQTQFNQVVIEGDSSVEAAQARVSFDDIVYDTLKARLDAENIQVAQRLAQKVDNYKLANAKATLNIKTYDGSNQATHPSVEMIPRTFTASGARYVMAYTPYPNTNDDYENPCLAWSYNGEDWFNWGANNPIDKPTTEEIADGAFMSDVEIIFNSILNRLELYYRFNHENNGNLERLYRKTSTDGLNWSARELVIDKGAFGHGLMSPSIHFDGTKYIMWAVAYTNKIYRYESTTALSGSWTLIGEVTLNYVPSLPNGYRTWHLHARWDNKLNGYIFTLNSLAPESGHIRHLLIGLSLDGNTVNDINIIMLPNQDPYAFDSYYLYRASLIRNDSGLFYLYYGAYNGSKWAIGLTKSVDVDNPYLFTGFDYRTNLGAKKLQDIIVESITTDNGAKLSDDELLLKTNGVKAAKIKNTANNELQVQSEGGALASLKASKLTTGEVLSFYVEGVKSGQLKMADALTFDILNEGGTNYLRLKVGTLVPMTSINIPVGSKVSWVGDGNAVDQKLASSGNILETLIGGNTSLASQKMSSVILSGDGVSVEGAIRYNTTTKKHQGYNGTTWNDLY